MQIVYLSLTGNIRKFVREGLQDSKAIELSYSDPYIKMDKEFVFIIPSYDQGIHTVSSKFLDYKDNYRKLVGVIGSGNTNFDNDYCFNATQIADKYNKPLLFKFEFSGNQTDIENFKEEVIHCNHQN